MIFTHPSLDIDAASASALLMYHMFGNFVPDQVTFVPSDWSGQLSEGDFAVDIQTGGFKGKQITSSKEGVAVLSSFSLVLKFLARPAYTEVYASLAEYLDIIDSNPPGCYSDKLSLQSVFNYLKAFCKTDPLLLRAWYQIIAGMMSSSNDLNKARKQSNRVQYYGQIVYYNGKYNLQLPGLIFRNKNILFFVYEFDNNIGVLRSPKYPRINMGEGLKIYLPDWFHHPSGFLTCWGGYKCPKKFPSEVSLERLIEFLLTIRI